MPKLDLEHRVGVIFTTIGRDEQARATVRSVRETFDNVAIYVSDQNPCTQEREAFYREQDVRAHFIPHDSGLSYGRNCLLEQVEEDFILLIDDDNIFDDRHHVDEAVRILDHDPEVAIVGGRHENVIHAPDGGVVDRHMKEPFDYLISYDLASASCVFTSAGAFGLGEERVVGNVRYLLVDVVENYALMRRSLFDDPAIRWDDSIKIIGEHLDFYLMLRRHPQHKVAFNERMILQNHVFPRPDYQELRNRNEYHQKYAEKWGIRHEVHLGKRLRSFEQDGTPRTARWDRLGTNRPVRREPRQDPLPAPADMARLIAEDCSFVCTTLERFECVKSLVISLRRHLGPVAIHCALQCEALEEAQKQFAERYDVDLFQVPYDHGLSAARNALVERVRTKYFVLCDDDFLFDRDCRLQDPLLILESCPEVAVVGGYYRDIWYDEGHNLRARKDLHFEFDFNYDRSRSTLIRLPLDILPTVVKSVHGVDFIECDCVQNLAVFRTAIFEDPALRWDAAMKITGEHLDFYLTLREKSDLKVAFCPSFSIQHNRRQNVRYRAMRGRTDGIEIFDQKWGIARDVHLGKGIRSAGGDMAFTPIPMIIPAA